MKKLTTVLIASVLLTSCGMIKSISHNIDSNYEQKAGKPTKSAGIPFYANNKSKLLVSH